MQRIHRLNPNGIDENEVAGINALERELPENWRGYANYELRDPREPLIRQREIDVILATHDRLLLIDLKNWRGVITNVNGQWARDNRITGPSPVPKLHRNAKKLADLMRKEFPTRDVPIVEHFVIMCAPKSDVSQLPPEELARTLHLPFFIELMRDDRAYDKTFHQPSRPWNRQRPFCGLSRELDHFFSVGKNFEPQKLWFADAYPVTEPPRYSHPSRIYDEYNVSRFDNPAFLALLRVWDFEQLPARASAPAFRDSVAKRELNVLQHIETNDYDLYRDGVLKSEIRDETISMRYWEIFRRSKSMARLRDALAQGDLSYQERVDNARRLSGRLAALHRIGIAHTDLSENSVWLDRERNSVMLSNFGAAHFPEVESLRDFRAYLAASDVPVPDELSQASTGDAIFLRDIYLGAVLTWTLLTGLEPPVVASALGVNESALSSAPISDALKVWFGKALSCNRETRFSSMEDAFAAFIAATDDTDLRLGQRRLDPFRTDDEPHFTYPPRTKADVIKQGNAHIWLHSGSDAGSLVIKTWPHRGTRPEDRLHAILAFFDRVNLLRTSAVPWAPEVVDFGLTETCIFIAERFIDAHDLNQIQDEWLAPHQVAEIVLALIDAVGSLHQLGLTHGDLKPEHVKVGTRDGKFVVILIDLHDYSGDERRASNIAYSAPLDNADWETHDRFAVCKIVERLCERISQGNDGCRLDVLSAVARCGDEDHSWRTLAPLALEAAKFQSVTARPRIELRVAGSKKAELLQPNGDVIYLVRQPEGVVTFVGSNRQIQMNLASDSEITTSRATTATLQWAMRSGEQLQVDVLIRPAAKSDLSDARKFIESLDPRQAELPAPDLAETAPLLREGALAPRASALSKSGIDVRHLWNEIIKIEMEQRPSVIVAAAPVFDQALGLHLIPCGDVDVSEFDFGGADVSIKKNDKQVAILDPFATQPGFLAARELKRADSVRVNDRLTLESVLESEDLRRRSTAVARVLSDNAVIPKLIDYFDPDSGALPVPFYRNSPGSDDLEQYCLNDGQKRAFQLLWQRRPLGLLQGPPGTGKTDFIAAFVHYAVTKANLRNVLVLSQSHEAANAVTSRIKRIGLEQKNPASMLRFGLIEKLSEDLLPIHAGAIQSGYREDFVTTLPLRIVEFSQRLGISRDYARKAFELERDIRALMRSPRLIDVASTTLVGDIDVPALIALLERFAVRGSTLLGQLKHALHDALADQLRVTNPAGVAAYRHLLELSWNWDAALRGHGRTLESFLAQSRSVVCGTCVGAGKKNLGIDAHVYDLVVVDEAARCGPGELAVAIQSAAWVILVGDHKQLPPVIDGDIVDELRARLAVSEVALLASDFERVFQSKYGLAASATLTTQYRMAPTIRALVAAHFYQEEGLEDGRGDPPEYYKLLSEPFGAPVTWYDTADLGEDAREHKVGDSYNNAMEARIIVDLLQRISKRRSFWAAADAGTSIGVICMYAEQRRLVREYVQGSELPSEFRRRVKIDTVDGYQGQQNDIIIVSLVRNNPFGKVGFARDKRRANVALSRARERLLLVGSAACFESSPADDNALCRMPDYLRTLAGFGNRVLRATLPDIGNG